MCNRFLKSSRKIVGYCWISTECCWKMFLKNFLFYNICHQIQHIFFIITWLSTVGKSTPKNCRKKFEKMFKNAQIYKKKNNLSSYKWPTNLLNGTPEFSSRVCISKRRNVNNPALIRCETLNQRKLFTETRSRRTNIVRSF